MRPRCSLAVALLLLWPASEASAEWLAPRGDSRNSGVVAGSAPDSPDRALIWRLPFGFASDPASVIASTPDTPLTVVRDGVVQSFAADAALLSTSPPLGFDALVGWLDARLLDGSPALVALRTGRDVAVLDTAGSLVALSPRIDPTFGPSAAFTVLGSGPWSILTAPASTLSIFAWGHPQSDGLDTTTWQRRFEGAPASLRFVIGDFSTPASDELLGLDTGTVFVVNTDTGELIARPEPFFTTAGTGFSQVVDVDGDAIDELAFAHTTASGYARFGVMRPVAGEFVWWIEYLNPARTTQLVTVREAVADIDADGDLEFVVSVFDSQDFETTAFPAGALTDLDGVDAPGRWTTLVLDLETGAVEQRLSDRIVRGILPDGASPVLMLSDVGTASALSLATLELLRVGSDGALDVLATLPFTDVARAAIAIERDRHNPRDPTSLIGNGAQTVVVVRDARSGLPLRYDSLRLSGSSVETTPLIDADGGEAAPVRAETDGRSVWVTPDGLQVRDQNLATVGAPVPGPGRTTTLRAARGEADVDEVLFAFRGASSNVLAFERNGALALPQSTFAAADLFVGQLYGVLANESLYWAVRVAGVDGLDGLAFIDAANGDYTRFALDVPPDVSNGIAAVESLGLVAMTYVDNRLAGNARFRMQVFDVATARPVGPSWPLDFDRAPLTTPMAWTHDGEARFVASTFGRIRLYDVDGSVLLAINNEGQNRPLLAADVTGDGVLDVVAGAVAPTAGAPRRFCAWDGVTGARIWCEDDASAALSPNATIGELPVDVSARSDVLLAYPDGEVRRVDATSGDVVWRACLDAGAATSLDVSDDATRCDGARVTPPVVADVVGAAERELLFGSIDGFLYTLDETGALVRSDSTGSGVAQLAAADVDGDGSLDVLVSLLTGDVAAFAAPRIGAPEDVIDVAINPESGEIGLDDIDETNERDRAAVRWTADPEAGGWRVAIRNEDGIEVGEAVVPAGEPSTIVERLPLVAGVRYEAVVQAISAVDGTFSIESTSDGFVVAPLDEIVITYFGATPSVVIEDLDATFELQLRVVGPNALQTAEFTAGASAERTVVLDATTSTFVETSFFVGADELATPGTLTIEATVRDELGLTATAQFEVIVEPDVGPDDTGIDVGPDAADSFETSDDFDDIDASDTTAAEPGDDAETGADVDVDVDVVPLPGDGCSCRASGAPPGSVALGSLMFAALLLLRRRGRQLVSAGG